jgi:hypothetical protein
MAPCRVEYRPWTSRRVAGRRCGRSRRRRVHMSQVTTWRRWSGICGAVERDGGGSRSVKRLGRLVCWKPAYPRRFDEMGAVAVDDFGGRGIVNAVFIRGRIGRLGLGCKRRNLGFGRLSYHICDGAQCYPARSGRCTRAIDTIAW